MNFLYIFVSASLERVTAKPGPKKLFLNGAQSVSQRVKTHEGQHTGQLSKQITVDMKSKKMEVLSETLKQTYCNFITSCLACREGSSLFF